MTSAVQQLNITGSKSSAIAQKMIQVLITDDNGAHNLSLRVSNELQLNKSVVLSLAEKHNGKSFVNPYNVLFTDEEEFNA